MPNRIIKESICTSENLDRLGAEEERFFFRLMVCCDDFGVLDARPAILRSRCFPLKECISKEDVEKWLARLAEAGLVLLYQSEGKPYLKLATWEEHQRIRNKRHKYPMPEGYMEENTSCLASCGNLQQTAADGSDPRPESESQSESESNPKVESESQSEGAGGRVVYAQNVLLTREEYAAVSAKIGEAGARRAVEMLDNYKGASGKQYASDYRAILSWVLKRVEEERAKGNTGFSQRTYEPAHFERDREESIRMLDEYTGPE